MKRIAKKYIARLLNKNKIKGTTGADTKMIKTVLKNIEDLTIDSEIENIHVKKWSVLSKRVSPLWFRAYSNLLKNKDINIIPDNIYHSIVEPLLNNYSYSQFYEEKNFYDFIFTPDCMPITIIRNIDGIFYNQFYKKIDYKNEILFKTIKSKEIIVKPTIDSGSGKNVDKFIFDLQTNQFKNKFGIVLSIDFLFKQYKKNYIIQECLKQNAYLNQFNDSSINTFRVLTYKSVVDNEIKILHVTLRVGLKGSHLDNAHAGGRFCGISNEGKLSQMSFNDKGETSNYINNIDLRDGYIIPQYDKIIQFAKKIANQTYHLRILSLDIMLDEKDEPRLIELNPEGQGVFIFQMTNGPMLGEYTDEIIDYCSERLNDFLDHYVLDI